MVALPIHDEEYEQGTPQAQVIQGDCLSVMRGMESNSVDAIVSDPPAGISFMNMEFDSDKGGRDNWIAWLTEVMREALRCLKPGGHALIWSLPRTSHWTATALEDAGFEVRDCISHLYGTDSVVDSFLASLSPEQAQALEMILASEQPSSITHLFGSGFPKSMSLDKAIDAHLGKSAEREVVGNKRSGIGRNGRDDFEVFHGSTLEELKHIPVTSPATPEATKYAGYGTALKPSAEFWWLVRKPLSESTIAENVLRWNGCGGLNIDASRIGTQAYTQEQWTQKGMARVSGNSYGEHKGSDSPVPQGRFPANTLFSHTPMCKPIGAKRVKGTAPRGKPSNGQPTSPNGITYSLHNNSQGIHYNDPDGTELIQAYECAEGCPVSILSQQSGVRNSHGTAAKATYGGIFGNGKEVTGPIREADAGTAARYFQTFQPEITAPFIYQSKASKRDRSSNGTVENTHPTCKNTTLMAYLCRLVTPEGGIILDPFMGSGSTGVAALQEGFHFIGIEQSEEYCAISRARIFHALHETTQVAREQEWECVPECPIRVLGEQSGVRKSGGKDGKRYEWKQDHGASAPFAREGDLSGQCYADQGTAARFFAQFPPDSLWASVEMEDTAHE